MSVWSSIHLSGWSLLISSLIGLALIGHVQCLGKPCDLKSILEALPGKLDTKRHSPSILYHVEGEPHPCSQINTVLFTIIFTAKNKNNLLSVMCERGM